MSIRISIFDWFIILVIVVSSIILAFESFERKVNSFEEIITGKKNETLFFFANVCCFHFDSLI